VPVKIAKRSKLNTFGSRIDQYKYKRLNRNESFKYKIIVWYTSTMYITHYTYILDKFKHYTLYNNVLTTSNNKTIPLDRDYFIWKFINVFQVNLVFWKNSDCTLNYANEWILSHAYIVISRVNGVHTWSFYNFKNEYLTIIEQNRTYILLANTFTRVKVFVLARAEQTTTSLPTHSVSLPFVGVYFYSLFVLIALLFVFFFDFPQNLGQSWGPREPVGMDIGRKKKTSELRSRWSLLRGVCTSSNPV
jgi:hypothetical protein